MEKQKTAKLQKKNPSSESSKKESKDLKQKSRPIPKQKEIIELLEKLVEMEIKYGPITNPANRIQRAKAIDLLKDIAADFNIPFTRVQPIIEALEDNLEERYSSWRQSPIFEERIALTKIFEEKIKFILQTQSGLFKEIKGKPGEIIFQIPGTTMGKATSENGKDLLDLITRRLIKHFTVAGKDCRFFNEKLESYIDAKKINAHAAKGHNTLLAGNLLQGLKHHTNLTSDLSYKAIARVFKVFQLESGTYKTIHNTIRTRTKPARNKFEFSEVPQV